MTSTTTEHIAIAAREEMGKIKIHLLKRLWSKTIAKKLNQVPQDHLVDEWPAEVTMLNILGIGIEQFFRELLHDIISFEVFEERILAINGGITNADEYERFNNLITKGEINGDDEPDEDLLSKEDLAFWDEHGYVIIHDAMPRENILAAELAVWDFLSMNREDSNTWYQNHPARQGIMVQFFQHPALQANRDAVKIRRAYEQLWNSKELWVSMDRVSFNPPENEQWVFPGPRLHFDVSLDMPMPFGLQGLLYLTDTAANQGAFTLVPGFHKKINEWISNMPAGMNPRQADLYELGAVPIEGKAGDFILWHQALPHGSSPNTAARPRIVQYINWQPVNPEIVQKWI